MSSSDTTPETALRAGLNAWEEMLVTLLSIPSVTGSEERASIMLESYLARFFPEAEVSRQAVAPGRWNVIMSRGEPKVTLTSHIDTVPDGPSVAVTPESIIGRGACDAKGQIVAQLWGLWQACQRGLANYRCAYVVGEEVDSVGARAFLDLPTTPYILNGEPTGNLFARRSWGVVDVELETTGRSAHSSLGAEDSAIHALVDDLSSLLRDVPDGMSLNVGTIRGGSAPNVQAAAASCQVCARVRGGIEPLRKLFKERLRRARWRLPDQATLGLELFVPESRCESALEVKFGSDCSIFAQRYERIMLFGPGSIADAHTEDERLSRTELAEAAAVLAGVLKEIA